MRVESSILRAKPRVFTLANVTHLWVLLSTLNSQLNFGSGQIEPIPDIAQRLDEPAVRRLRFDLVP